MHWNKGTEANAKDIHTKTYMPPPLPHLPLVVGQNDAQNVAWKLIFNINQGK